MIVLSKRRELPRQRRNGFAVCGGSGFARQLALQLNQTAVCLFGFALRVLKRRVDTGSARRPGGH